MRAGGTERNTPGRREFLLDLLRNSAQPRSILSLAEELEVHANTVRFHLDTLVRGVTQVDDRATVASQSARTAVEPTKIIVDCASSLRTARGALFLLLPRRQSAPDAGRIEGHHVRILRPGRNHARRADPPVYAVPVAGAARPREGDTNPGAQES